MLLSAWRRLLPPPAVYGGATAGWLLGLDLQPTNPIEVIVPVRSGCRSRACLNVRHCNLSQGDVARVRGLPVTTVQRTLRDLCLRLPAVEALVAIDAAVRSGLVDARALVNPRRLSDLAELAAPAESPMETRLRWLLLQAGLPRPEVQTDLRDGDGRFVGRADLYYPAARLVIEYDGVNHRERLIEDNRRQNLLITAGYTLLRFTAADIEKRAVVIEAQVRQALRR